MKKIQILSLLLCVAILLPSCSRTRQPVDSDESDPVSCGSLQAGTESGEDSVSSAESGVGIQAPSAGVTSGQQSDGSPVSGTNPSKGSFDTKTTSTTLEKVSVNVDKALAPSTAEASTLLNDNPDRGFRLEISLDVQWLSTSGDTVGDINKAIDEQVRKCSAEKETVAQVYMYLDGYHGKSISQKGLKCVQQIFDLFRERKMKMLLRFAYQRDMGRGGETTQIILSHIDQLADVVHKNKDMIYSLQAGFVGAWGEWHSESPAVDKPAILKKIADVLLPDGTYMMTRLPQYKNLLDSSNPAFRRIGFNNDCFWGKMNSSAYGSGGFDPDTAVWSQAMKESPYCPQDGELYWNSQCEDLQDYCDGYKAILGFSELRYTTFSVLHSYLDGKINARTSMGDWQKATLTKDWLQKNGIPYAPSWFLDKNGNTVNRTVFDFVRDYLGYKLEAQHVTVTGQSAPGQTVQVSMPLINYGFSAAFNLESGFAILDANNQVVQTVRAGSPETWYVTDPTNYSDRTVLTHTVSASVTLPNKEGQYKLAFYLKNDIGSFARLGNDLEYVNGYTVLHNFVL